MAYPTADNAAILAAKLEDSSSKVVTEDDLVDGHSAAEIFDNKGVGSSRTGYTYDDLILLPGQIDFGLTDVQLTSRFSKKITLKTPVVSSPMDTVTESRMAIAMALHGGIGIIHTNLPMHEQVKEVLRVKKYESGFIVDPMCIKPDMLLEDLDRLRSQCGFT
eukprot:4458985-Amphidinium_carterae.2